MAQHLLHITITQRERYQTTNKLEVSYSYALIDELTAEMRDWISTKYNWTRTSDDAYKWVNELTARDGFFTFTFYDDDNMADADTNGCQHQFSIEFKRGRELAKKVFTSYDAPQSDKAALCIIETRFYQDFLVKA